MIESIIVALTFSIPLVIFRKEIIRKITKNRGTEIHYYQPTKVPATATDYAKRVNHHIHSQGLLNDMYFDILENEENTAKIDNFRKGIGNEIERNSFSSFVDIAKMIRPKEELFPLLVDTPHHNPYQINHTILYEIGTYDSFQRVKNTIWEIRYREARDFQDYYYQRIETYFEESIIVFYNLIYDLTTCQLPLEEKKHLLSNTVRDYMENIYYPILFDYIDFYNKNMQSEIDYYENFDLSNLMKVELDIYKRNGGI